MVLIQNSSALLCLWIFVTFLKSSAAVGIHDAPQVFCYTSTKCGPKSAAWGGSCHNHKRQSPINILIDSKAKATQKSEVPLDHFKADHFFMQNNGHTINLDFTPIDRDGFIFPGLFPAADTKYRFANAHFHWGKKDNMGSEHEVNGKKFAMEMHLVHYNEKYNTLSEAILSGNENALAVVAIFLEVDKSTKPVPELLPVIKNLKPIHETHSWWIKVEEPLDLTPLIPPKGSKIYSYKGSLTTPGCNEQVNWFVFGHPTKISKLDVLAFRNVVDGSRIRIVENFRPVEPLNGREIKIIELI